MTTNAQTTTGAASAATRPENVPEKFWDATKGAINTDALLQSYTELERTRSAQPPANTPAAPASKVDMAALDADIAASGGELTDELYTKYEQQGLPRELLDRHVGALKAEYQQFESKVFEVAGGSKEQYDAVREWAKTNVPRAELEAFNTALEGSNEQALLAVHGLVSRYRAANGNPPNGLLNGGSGNPSTDVFNSWAEVQVAMRDPRYSSDPAYRNSVVAKLDRSNPKSV